MKTIDKYSNLTQKQRAQAAHTRMENAKAQGTHRHGLAVLFNGNREQRRAWFAIHFRRDPFGRVAHRKEAV
jgi:hypothetical protein